MKGRIDGYTIVSWNKISVEACHFCGRCRKPATWERRTVKVAKTHASLVNTYYCELHKKRAQVKAKGPKWRMESA